LLVAHLDQQPAGDAGAELRVRIRERVEQRRQAAESARGHQEVSQPPGSANGRATYVSEPAAPAASGAEPAAPAASGAEPIGPAAPGAEPAVSASGSAIPQRSSRSGRHAVNGRTAGTSLIAVAEPISRPLIPSADRPATPSGTFGRPDWTGQPQLPGRVADRTATPGRRRHAAASPAPGLLRRTARWVVLLAFTAAAVFGLRQYVIASYYIPSASMETTLHGCPGCQPDLVLVDKLSYRFKSVSRKDVVVFGRPPQAPPEDKQLIKRVIGLPGEVVSGHDGHVFVNDKELVEPYVDPACHGTADFAAVRVPAGRYFVMGDNRCDSFDSRMFGTIPRSAVIGRAFAVIWPAHHLRWL
jgi:signal peptidase I